MTVTSRVEQRSQDCPATTPETTTVGGGTARTIESEAVPTLPAASATCAVTVLTPSAPERVRDFVRA